MADERRQELRRRLSEAVDASKPDEGLLNTGTGVAFWRERTYLAIASIVEEALDQQDDLVAAALAWREADERMRLHEELIPAIDRLRAACDKYREAQRGEV